MSLSLKKIIPLFLFMLNYDNLCQNHRKKLKLIFFNLCQLHANFMIIYVQKLFTDGQPKTIVRNNSNHD